MLAHRAAVAALSIILLVASQARSQDCAPEIVNTFDTPGKAQRFAIAGDLAAVADGTAGVRFLDISDPTRPRSLSQVPAIFAAEDVAITGDVAAFIDTDGFNASGRLWIVDISDPRNPQVASRINPGLMKPNAVEAWDGIVAFSLGCPAGFGEHRLELYDVADPKSPRLLSIINARPRDVVFRDGLLYTAGVDGLIIFDVTDPSAPLLVGSLDIPELGRYMSISGDIAYVTTGMEGLFIIDIADPTNPQLLSTILTTGASNSVVTIGTTAYVSFNANPSGLDVIDITDPLNPVLIGSTEVMSIARGVELVGDGYLLLANSGSGVHTIDISTCEPCPADLDGDTDLDADDFFLYLDAFASGDLTICDIDQDADCDAEDFFGYLDLFAAGC